MQRLLMIDDDARLAAMVRDYLGASGYAVEVSGDIASGMSALRARPADLLILDLMLPDGDGLEACRRMRAEGVDLPILMLTAKGDPIDRVIGLEIGADDYLAKPFRMEELLARARALIRRSAGHGAVFIDAGPLHLDARQMRVLLNEVPVNLSPLEYRLVAYLMHHKGRVVPAPELLDHLYGDDDPRETNALEAIMTRLRRKLGGDAIETRRGFGYMIPDGG